MQHVMIVITSLLEEQIAMTAILAALRFACVDVVTGVDLGVILALLLAEMIVQAVVQVAVKQDVQVAPDALLVVVATLTAAQVANLVA